MMTNQESDQDAANYDRRKEARKSSSNGNKQAKADFSESKEGATEERAVRMQFNSESKNDMSAIILEHLEQGSEEWQEVRRECITMSHAKDLITKPRTKNGVSLTRLSYLISVASESITNVSADTFKSWQMDRGNILEPFARQAYIELTGQDIREVGFGYLNADKRIGASPDGLGANHGMEIKCQLPKNHLATIIRGFEPKEFDPQMQGSMWVFDKEYWEYVSFCPEFPEQPIFIHRVNRDEEMIKAISESALKGVEEIDEFIKKGRLSTPTKGLKSICKEALLTIETLSNKEPDIF